MSNNDMIGSIGVGMILIAYFCNTFKILSKDGKLFFLLNISGALLACFASFLISYWPFVILEGTWTIVSIAGLFKTIKRV